MTTSLSNPAQRIGAGGVGQADLYASTVKSLLAKNPGLKNIDAQLSRDTARLSVLGKLALALDDFRSSAIKLSGDKLDTALTVSGKGVTAQLTGATAAAGNHTVEVKQLAQGQTLATKALPDKGAAIGSGAPTLIKVAMGSGSDATTTTVRIDAGNNTLDGIAKAMRDAGLDAKIVQDGKGYALSLTGKTGAGNTMRVSAEGDPALGALFSFGTGTQGAMTQQSAAQDAQLVVDGKAVTSSTNKLDAAIPGITLNLTAVGKGDVKVVRDPAAVAGKVKDLVEAFNTLGAKLGKANSGDAAQDALVGRLKSQLGRVLDSADPQALAEIGITRKDGGLALDESKLKAALAADPDKVAGLFGKVGGLADQFVKGVSQQLTKGGMLAEQAASVQGHVDKLKAQKAQVTEVVQRQASMIAQQYALAGAGGSSLFGLTGGPRPASLFDFMA